MLVSTGMTSKMLSNHGKAATEEWAERDTGKVKSTPCTGGRVIFQEDAVEAGIRTLFGRAEGWCMERQRAMEACKREPN